jgi:hypothetical protein
LKNAVLWDVTLVTTDVSKEHSGFIIRVSRISELGTTLAVKSNAHRLLFTANVVFSSPILVTLMTGSYVLPKSRFLQESHCVSSQKTASFIVTAAKTSNLT